MLFIIKSPLELGKNPLRVRSKLKLFVKGHGLDINNELDMSLTASNVQILADVYALIKTEILLEYPLVNMGNPFLLASNYTSACFPGRWINRSNFD